MIRLDTVHLQLGHKTLLESASLTIYPGQKWGLIGSNGSGKSSLFKLLLAELQEDKGQCQVPRDWQLAHMRQELGTTSVTALNHVLDGDRELRELQNRIEHAEGAELAKLYERLEQIDGYTAEARAQQLLFGLGFDSADDSRPVSDFSGGWQIRLNLAQALMCRSDCLLLDEPTNHLDLDASFWLENWLNAYPGTLIIISHDRDFLDAVVKNIASLENRKLFAYTGNYSAYETQKAERLAQQTAAFEKQQDRISEIENFVRRFRAQATKAKQAQSRLKELERMEKIAPAHIDSPFSFRFPSPEQLPASLVHLDNACIGYTSSNTVSQVNLNILPTSRIGLLGKNGAGKSTLIKTLAGDLPLLEGTLSTHQHVRIGYFAQHQFDALDLQASGALHLQRLRPDATEQEIRNFLGGFGFSGERALEPITHFSGGEKARLALAIVAWKKPNILLMDEPTNHLDIEMCHALTMALQSFEGAILMVSHDRHLLKNTVDEFALVHDGKVDSFDGSLQDYQHWLQKSGKAENSDITKYDADVSVDKKNKRQLSAARREKLKPLTNRIKALEREMTETQKALESIDQQLADPSCYESPGSDLSVLIKKQSELRTTLEDIENDWLENSEQLETLRAGDDT